MSEWKEITSQKGIDELLYTCGGFHDTCIVSVNYRCGAFVDEKNAMHFGTCNDHELTVGRLSVFLRRVMGTYIAADKMKWRAAGNGDANISLEK